MSRKKLLMVTPWLRFVKKAKAEDLYFISMWNKEERGKEFLPQIAGLSDECYIFDIHDTNKLERIIDSIEETSPVDYIYHAGREDTMLDTYRIAEKHGKALNPIESIERLNHKYKMRQLLDEKQISTIRYLYINDTEDVYTKAEQFGYPLIIKPVDMSGSRGVFLCKQNKDMAKFKAYVEKYQYDGPFLMEEYLEGIEVSIEALSVNGEHYIVGITDKIKTPPPYFVEMGHVHPSQLTESQQQEISQLVIDLLHASGYQFGPSHSEVIVTDQGPKIVESQARLGGDQIPILVDLATGIDMEAAIFQLLNGQPLSTPSRQKVAMIKYLAFPVGKLDHVSGIEEMSALPFVHAISFPFKPGDHLPLILDSKKRHGYFIVTGDTYEQVLSHLDEVDSTLQVHVTTEERQSR